MALAWEEQLGMAFYSNKFVVFVLFTISLGDIKVVKYIKRIHFI